MNKFEQKKIELDALSNVYNTVESVMNDLLISYEVVGKTTEQKTHWRTGELLWEDDAQTIPLYEDEYGYVNKTYEELSEENKIKYDTYANIIKALEKMM